MRASKESCRVARGISKGLESIFVEVFNIGDDDLYLSSARCPTDVLESTTEVFTKAENDFADDPVCLGCKLKRSQHNDSISERFRKLGCFLDAAERKLPSDAAYDREKERRKERDAKRQPTRSGRNPNKL